MNGEESRDGWGKRRAIHVPNCCPSKFPRVSALRHSPIKASSTELSRPHRRGAPQTPAVPCWTWEVLPPGLPDPQPATVLNSTLGRTDTRQRGGISVSFRPMRWRTPGLQRGPTQKEMPRGLGRGQEPWQSRAAIRMSHLGNNFSECDLS
jgi:hypothetical protein